MAKQTIKITNKGSKTISESFGVSEAAFKHVVAKIASKLTLSAINPFDDSSKDEVAMKVMAELPKDKEAFVVKDMNTAFVFGTAFFLAMKMRNDLLDALDKKVKEEEKPATELVSRMAQKDFEEIQKGIGMVGEQVKTLIRQKVIN
jgi:hypothetical protein